MLFTILNNIEYGLVPKPKNTELKSNNSGLNHIKAEKLKETNTPQKYKQLKDTSEHICPSKPDKLEQPKGKLDIVNEGQKKKQIQEQKSLENQAKSKANAKEKDANYHAKELETSTEDITNTSTQNGNKCSIEIEKSESINKKPESEHSEVKDKETMSNDQEEEEEDLSGMKTIRKETDNKLADMEAEFEAGRSKLAALRARIRRTRENAKASSEADSNSLR